MKTSACTPRLTGIATLCAVASLSLLTPGSAVAAPQFTVLHSFSNASTVAAKAGYEVSGHLAMDRQGTLYGTTGRGGSACPTGQYSCGGTVFKLARPARGSTKWRYAVIASFAGGRDGSYPLSGVTRTKQGVLYGTTQYGGAMACTESHHWGCGTLFELKPPARGATRWTRSVLHRFAGGNKDGRLPNSPPFHGNGKLYGTTPQGGGGGDNGIAYTFTLGSANATPQAGSAEPIFLSEPVRLYTPVAPNAAASYALMYGWPGSSAGGKPGESEECQDDAEPGPDADSGCVCMYGVEPDGKTCCNEGEDSCLDDDAHHSAIRRKHSLSAAAAAPHPFRGDGSIYGVTNTAGDDDCVGSGNVGCGVIYQFKPKAGGTFSYNVLYSFLGGSDGYWPIGKLTIGPDGALYGTTLWGGKSCREQNVAGRGCGTVFRLKPPARGTTQWAITILYRFAGGRDGAFPAGGVVLGRDGALYGATTNGGGGCTDPRGCGTIFKLTPQAGAKPWRRTILHTFQNKSDGMSPNGPLLYDNTGAIYGTALDVVFRITP